MTSYLTIAEIRRANLQLLIDEIGSQRALADAAEISPAQVSQWVKAAPDSKTGKPRVVSDESARGLEKAAGKPLGWMDHQHGESVDPQPLAPLPSLPQALEVLGIALAADIPDDVRQDAADLLAKLAHRRGSSRHQVELLALLKTARTKHQAAA